MIDEQGCFDIDECIKSNEYCLGNQFCINKEGGYTCLSMFKHVTKKYIIKVI